MKSNEEKEQRKKRLNENKHIITVGVILGLLLGAMLGYFVWFMVSERQETMARTENNRYDSAGTRVIRGDIITSDRVAIAYTQPGSTADEDVRVYPFHELFAPISGYTAMGRTGLESAYHRTMMTTSLNFMEVFRNDLLNQRSMGDRVVMTIDSDLQYYCYTLLGEYNGSITVVDAETGRILAMVSKPTFDPNLVKEQWSELVSEDNKSGNLLNRSTQGLYSPGSTFKIVTAIEYMRENPETYRDFSYTCNGSITIGDHTVHCEGAHGTVNMESAMAYSCNGAFVTMGMTLDRGKYGDLIKELGFGSKLIDELPSSKSTSTINRGTDDFEMMQTVFGQGQTMESPLQNVMITAMIANKGVMMKPFIVDHLEDANGIVTEQTEPRELKQILTAEQVDYLNQLLTATINYGTSPQAQSPYCQVAGKSGTAQYSSSLERTHAWFTAYAPAEDTTIAITIMLEQGGHGSPNAAPLASAIVNYLYERD